METCQNEQIIGFAIFCVLFTTLLMITGSCLMIRIDALARVLENDDP